MTRRVEIVPTGRNGTLARIEVYVDGERTFVGRATVTEAAREEARRLARGGGVKDHTKP
jgi:hypothetical protein